MTNNRASSASSSQVFNPLGGNHSSSSSTIYGPFAQDDVFSCPPQSHPSTSTESSWRPHDPFNLVSSRTYHKLPVKSSTFPSYYFSRPPTTHYQLQPQSEYIAPPPPSSEGSTRSNSSTRTILSKAISKHRIANNKKHFGWRTE